VQNCLIDVNMVSSISLISSILYFDCRVAWANSSSGTSHTNHKLDDSKSW
jgi:hypothetical protein